MLQNDPEKIAERLTVGEKTVDESLSSTTLESQPCNYLSDRKIVEEACDITDAPTLLDGTTAKRSEEFDSWSGATIGGHYQLIEKLGRGGEGVVYKARHLLIDRFVAIKLLPFHRQDDKMALQRFQREAKAASLLDHPNIVRVLEFGIHDATTPYLVMELVEGTSLSSYLAQKGKMSTLLATELGLQLCAGLSHAHKKGVIHRDMKPSNIIITTDSNGNETAKVVDFGIAKLLKQKDQISSTLTATGEIVGTPLYMSPEQCAGQELDERSDIYSLGCVLYEMVTGKSAVTAGSAMEAMMAHVNELDPIFEGTNVSPYFKSVVARCLKRDRAKRFSNVSQVHRTLSSLSKEDFLGRMAALDLMLEQNSTVTFLMNKAGMAFLCFSILLLGCLIGFASGANWALAEIIKAMHP